MTNLQHELTSQLKPLLTKVHDLVRDHYLLQRRDGGMGWDYQPTGKQNGLDFDYGNLNLR